jgi:hypothetical protein
MDGLDVFGVAGAVAQRSAQLRYGVGQGVVRDEAAIPDFVNELLSGHDSGGVAGEVHQDIHDLELEVKGVAVKTQLVEIRFHNPVAQEKSASRLILRLIAPRHTDLLSRKKPGSRPRIER